MKGFWRCLLNVLEPQDRSPNMNLAPALTSGLGVKPKTTGGALMAVC